MVLMRLQVVVLLCLCSTQHVAFPLQVKITIALRLIVDHVVLSASRLNKAVFTDIISLASLQVMSTCIQVPLHYTFNSCRLN